MERITAKYVVAIVITVAISVNAAYHTSPRPATVSEAMAQRVTVGLDAFRTLDTERFIIAVLYNRRNELVGIYAVPRPTERNLNDRRLLESPYYATTEIVVNALGGVYLPAGYTFGPGIQNADQLNILIDTLGRR